MPLDIWSRSAPSSPDLEQGGLSPESLEADDPSQAEIEPADRRKWVADLEQATLDSSAQDPVRSISAYMWDGRTESTVICSNGYSNGWAHTSLGHGATVSLEDADGRLPEAYAFYGTRHRTDLPGFESVAQDAMARARARLGSRPCESCRTTLLLENRSVSRFSVSCCLLWAGQRFMKSAAVWRKTGQTNRAQAFQYLRRPNHPSSRRESSLRWRRVCAQRRPIAGRHSPTVL